MTQSILIKNVLTLSFQNNLYYFGVCKQIDIYSSSIIMCEFIRAREMVLEKVH